MEKRIKIRLVGLKEIFGAVGIISLAISSAGDIGVLVNFAGLISNLLRDWSDTMLIIWRNISQLLGFPFIPFLAKPFSYLLSITIISITVSFSLIKMRSELMKRLHQELSSFSSHMNRDKCVEELKKIFDHQRVGEMRESVDRTPGEKVSFPLTRTLGFAVFAAIIIFASLNNDLPNLPKYMSFIANIFCFIVILIVSYFANSLITALHFSEYPSQRKLMPKNTEGSHSQPLKSALEMFSITLTPHNNWIVSKFTSDQQWNLVNDFEKMNKVIFLNRYFDTLFARFNASAFVIFCLLALDFVTSIIIN